MVLKKYCYFILNCYVNLFPELIARRFVASLMNNAQCIYKYWFCCAQIPVMQFVSLIEVFSLLLRQYIKLCLFVCLFYLRAQQRAFGVVSEIPGWLENHRLWGFWRQNLSVNFVVKTAAVILLAGVFKPLFVTAVCPCLFLLDICPIVSSDLFIRYTCSH